MEVYKFMPDNDNFSFFEKLTLKYSPASTYNDPLELHSWIDVSNTDYENKESTIQIEINLKQSKTTERSAIAPTKSNNVKSISFRNALNDIYFVCFSKINPLMEINGHLLMWSHYAEQHRGIAVAFKSESERIRNSHDVYYRDKPEIRHINDLGRPLPIQELYWKHTCWTYEQEVRHAIKDNGSVQSGHIYDIVNTNEINHILLGVNASQETIERAILFESKYKIPVYKMCVRESLTDGFRLHPSSISIGKTNYGFIGSLW